MGKIRESHPEGDSPLLGKKLLVNVSSALGAVRKFLYGERSSRSYSRVKDKLYLFRMGTIYAQRKGKKSSRGRGMGGTQSGLRVAEEHSIPRVGDKEGKKLSSIPILKKKERGALVKPLRRQ